MKWPIGIFTSIHGGLGAGLEAVKRLGVPTVQLHAPTSEHRTPERTGEIRSQFAEAGVEITVVFVGFPDDDYTTTEIVKKTVGLVPRERRE